MFSAHQGISIAKRIAVAVLMFVIGAMLMPTPGANIWVGAVRILLAFASMLIAIVGLVNLSVVSNLLRAIAILGGGALIVVFGIAQIWSTSGPIRTVLVACGIGIILLWASSSRSV